MRTDLTPGSTLAGYRIEGEAGRGGMGIVLRATQLALGRIVALKLIGPAVAADESFRARFRRESRLLASLAHPHIVTVYEAGEAEGHLFVSMRWIDGTDLRRLIAEDGPLPPRLAARLVAQVADALDAAHSAGVIHRDVKPANVLIEAAPSGPIAYLGDFGLSISAGSGERLTGTGGWVGTLDYAAPEQIEDRAVDPRTDVYSLGCVLYEAVTGSVPFPRGSDPARLWAHLHDPPPSARESMPSVPGELDAVIRRALAKEPDRRWPTAGDLGRAALAAVGASNGGATAVTPAPASARPDRARLAFWRRRRASHEAGTVALPGRPVPLWRRRRTRVAAGASAGVLALGGAGVALLTGGDDPPPRRAAATGPLPARPATVSHIELGRRVAPGDVGAAIGSAFVLDRRSAKLLIVDATSGLVIRRLPAGRRPETIATGDDDRAWIVDGAGALREVDTERGVLVGRPIEVQRDAAYAVDNGKEVVVLSRRDDGASLLRVDPRRRRAIGKPKEIGGAINDLAAYAGGVSVLSSFPPLLEDYDARLRRIREIPLVLGKGDFGDLPAELVIDGSTAWIVSAGGFVVRYDLFKKVPVGRPIPVGRKPRDIALADGVVWVPSQLDGTVTRIDVRSARPIGKPIRVGDIDGEVAAEGGDVWLGGAQDLVRVRG